MTGPPGDAGRLTRLLERPGRLLVVSDFDGTLAEGSRDPGAAAIVPLARVALRRLAAISIARPGRLAVAVLTGRTAADVATRVRVGGIHYLGDHGLQSGTYRRGGRAEHLVSAVQPGHDASIGPAEQLAARVPELLGRPSWLFVERKGPSVAFHVRQAEDRLAARAAVEAAIGVADRELPRHDLAHYRGRLVVDLRPRAAGGKREAFERLLAELRPSSVIAFGEYEEITELEERARMMGALFQQLPHLTPVESRITKGLAEVVVFCLRINRLTGVSEHWR